MEHEFWHAKWSADEIGFHEPHVHALLQKHWDALQVDATERVLVPLCGKSLDMPWLNRRGHQIVGVELSRIAVQDFFAENGMTPTRREVDGHTLYEAPGYQIFCGDYLSATGALIGPVGAVYDRAALIALPPSMRPDYARHTLTLMPAGGCLLLITLQFDSALFEGPPFPVQHEEIASLYAGAAQIEHLESSATRVKGSYDVVQTATRIVKSGT